MDIYTLSNRYTKAMNWIFDHCGGVYEQYAFALYQMGWDRDEIAEELEVECGLSDHGTRSILNDIYGED